MLGGLPLVVRVIQAAEKSELISELYVATDNDRIAAAVRDHGGNVVMTRPDHPTGTDRVAEALSSLGKCDLVVNIQGDEPLLKSQVIDSVITALDDPEIPMSTACCHMDERQADDPNSVKVVFDHKGLALYFSRSRIPYDRDIGSAKYYRHLGIYGFKREFLMKYPSLRRSPLEIAEGLEQLRALEHGFKIKTVVVDGDYKGIDSQEDLIEAEKHISERER